MNTREIDEALRRHPITKCIFRGVYSADEVPDFTNLPSGCIVNTDASDQPGSHWVALYQDKPGVIETFDSFGRELGTYSPHLANLAKKNRIISQSYQLQSDTSTVCGQYCIFFLLRRASHETYSHIIHLFTDYMKANDVMVCQYVNHYFKLNTEIQDDDFLRQL